MNVMDSDMPRPSFIESSGKTGRTLDALQQYLVREFAANASIAKIPTHLREMLAGNTNLSENNGCFQKRIDHFQTAKSALGPHDSSLEYTQFNQVMYSTIGLISGTSSEQLRLKKLIVDDSSKKAASLSMRLDNILQTHEEIFPNELKTKYMDPEKKVIAMRRLMGVATYVKNFNLQRLVAEIGSVRLLGNGKLEFVPDAVLGFEKTVEGVYLNLDEMGGVSKKQNITGHPGFGAVYKVLNQAVEMPIKRAK
jgi:hypothetical protein